MSVRVVARIRPLLKAEIEVRFRVLDPYKRPVSATADSHEVRDVVEVTVRESQDRTVTLTGPLDAPRIRELTAWATQNDTLPEALSVQPRSLEDVFLEVSGGNAP